MIVSTRCGILGKMEKKLEEVVKRARKDRVSFIDLQFSDFLGNIKSSTIPAYQLEKALSRGIWFDGSSVEGFARIHESDMYLLPDPITYSPVPFRSEDNNSIIARLICDVYTPEHQPFEGDPRCVLKKQIKKATQMGYTYKVGPEMEFFLFPKDPNGKIKRASRGNGYYFSLIMDESYKIKKEVMETLEKMGIVAETSTHEVADNQHEIDFLFDEVLRVADSAITLKLAVKSIAAKYGFYASFMPKPIYGINGSGMHTHQSLWKDKKNAFYDKNDQYQLSKSAYQFLAGQLNHISQICALVAPTVNSYKRLALGYEAPVYVCWARRNRSALIRIPECSKGIEEKATRLELRCPDPSANPYLAFAAMLAAGIDGIKRNLKPPPSVEEDVYEFDDAKLAKFYIKKLPGSLGEALRLMEKSQLAKEILGEYTFKRYLQTKWQEYDKFRTWVTDWEINRYLESV